MAPRATWKGYVKVAELAVPAALYAGASTAQRVSFHVLNRKTGNRVRREYIDEETEEPVEREMQVKGYDLGEDQYVILEPEEIAEAIPDSDKTIKVEAFLSLVEVDTIFFDKPYYIAPTGAVGSDSFAVLREGMRRKKVAAFARAVLFRRLRAILLRPEGPGLVASTLNFDYEVRSAEAVFESMPNLKIESEMLDLAKYIIQTKLGDFNPHDFDDRYDQALAELVKAKMEGREVKLPEPPREAKVVNLMDALRKSAAASGEAPKKRSKGEKAKKSASSRRRKAG